MVFLEDIISQLSETLPCMDCIILWKRPFTIYVINNYLWINDCEYMKIIYVNWG